MDLKVFFSQSMIPLPEISLAYEMLPAKYGDEEQERGNYPGHKYHDHNLLTGSPSSVSEKKRKTSKFKFITKKQKENQILFIWTG